jgi:hypothetical protein
VYATILAPQRLRIFGLCRSAPLRSHRE